MCYNTTGVASAVWTDRIFFDKFSSDTWKNNFVIDTWDNSGICCNDPMIHPTFNKVESIKVIGDKLVLRVSPRPKDDILAYSGSVSTRNDDFMYGSFRISMKVQNISGTAIGFFFYKSQVQEIDIEILTKELKLKRIRTATQPIARDFNNKASTLSQKTIISDKNPQSGYIEYRFDWFKDRVDFFLDNKNYHSLSLNVPNNPGNIVINHRSNGNPNWSSGPPVSFSDLTINYIDFYYNRTTGDDCREINAISGSFGSDTFNQKNTAVIVVGSVFGFMFLLIAFTVIYQKFVKKSSPGVVKNTYDIQERKP